MKSRCVGAMLFASALTATMLAGQSSTTTYTRYLSDGVTGPSIDTRIAIANAGARTATVVLAFVRSDGGQVTRTVRLAPASRVTVMPASIAGLEVAEFSTAITSDQQVVVDQTVSTAASGFAASRADTSVARASKAASVAPATSWFFAEGATGSLYDMYVVLTNATASAAVVDVRYLMPSGQVITKRRAVSAGTRANIRVDSDDPLLADTAVAVAIASTNGVDIVAERSMWWTGPSAATTQDVQTIAGATTTATKWAIADGDAGGAAAADTQISVGNISAATANLKVMLLFEDATPAEKLFTVPATSRFTMNLTKEFPSAAGKRFGAVVESVGSPAAQLVVERTMRIGGAARGPDSTAFATPLETAVVASGTTAATSADLVRSPGSAAVPATSTPAEASASAGVYNLTVVSDASPNLTDMDSLIRSTTSRWTTTAEKVWALFYWSHILKRQTAPMVLHGFDVTDPIRNFNDYGFTMCSTVSGINQSLYEALGLQHQYWDICNHTVSAVHYDGKFHMIDSSMSNLVTTVDGATVASVEEAAADSARLVREYSVSSTSARGFLTGSDAMRNLADFVNPVNGSISPGFARDFCADGLKYRDYYYNWNAGHRYVLNLRPDESYTRYYRRLGKTADYWVGSEKITAPDPAKTSQIDAADRFGIRGNGTWSFSPALSAAGWPRAVYRSTNIVASLSGGLAPNLAGEASDVTYKVQAANAITSQLIRAQFARIDPAATATIAVSLNHGATWTEVWSAGTVVGSAVLASVNLRTLVSGAYETLVRIQMSSGIAVAEGVRLTDVKIDTVTQVNTKALPKLNVGRNEIFVGIGDQSDTMALWPDLRGSLWKQDVYDFKNIASQSVAVRRKYTAVAYPAVLAQDAYLTYRMDSPADITRLVYGGRLHNFSAGSYIDFLHSIDGGATWVRSYHLSDASKPYDVIHYETINDVPPGVRTVLFKYLIHNTNKNASRASGLYAVRMEADHRPLTDASAPVDVTLRWKEIRADRTLVDRSHRQRVSEFPFKYVVNVGGSDHPVMESLKVSLADPGDATPYGYEDGTDDGGQKYVHRKQTSGTNVALNKPYTSSRAPSAFQASARAGNTAILTDGVVGAPMTGGDSYLWGQCWSSGRAVDLQIDLGGAQPVGAFRAHLFGYPFWDALKGQVKDRVEILISVDGVTFVSQGLLQTSLWKKDVPINYMLLDDEKATAWNFELALAAPVSARYIRYHVTPQRNLCVSELQVLDRVDYAPFDIRIALPDVVQ